MEAWERDHPESTFAKAIEKVDNVIKKGKPFLEVIPDSPFPARSIALGLAHLLQLGTVRIIPTLFMFQALMIVCEGNHDGEKRSVRIHDASVDLVPYNWGICSNGDEAEIYYSGQKEFGCHKVGIFVHRPTMFLAYL